MRRRNGFTIVELLAVITILGILASIGLPRYAYLKNRAYVATMTSDLRNLMTAQESFYAANDDYAGSIATGNADVPGTGGAGAVAFNFSQDVELVRLRYRYNRRRGQGWNAVVRHRQVKDKTIDRCGIYVGADNYSPNKAVTSPGTVACW